MRKFVTFCFIYVVFLSKVAVENGFGGSDSQEKAQWLVFAIDQWFTENSKFSHDVQYFYEESNHLNL